MSKDKRKDLRVQIGITLPTNVLAWIDKKRGLIKRSTFIAYLLGKAMETEEKRESGMAT
jgi:metal-responsive CopG/Arc/MetJ family transcriptional regulator